MPYKDYKILNELRSGGTSHVYNVMDNDTGELRVMKVTSFQQIKKIVWLNEIQMLQKFQYIRGVVKMYEFGEVEDSTHEKFGYAVLEQCGDDLFENPIQENERKAVFLFLYNILTTIHAMGYCYCDLKPENILRKGSGFRLCDFSSCQPIGTLTNVMYGTPHVMAPEIVQTLDEKKDYFYDEKIDSWGLGCLLYELITHEQFDRNDLTRQINSISDPYYKPILQLCLDVNPLSRVRVWELSKRMKDLPGYVGDLDQNPMGQGKSLEVHDSLQSIQSNEPTQTQHQSRLSPSPYQTLPRSQTGPPPSLPSSPHVSQQASDTIPAVQQSHVPVSVPHRDSRIELLRRVRQQKALSGAAQSQVRTTTADDQREALPGPSKPSRPRLALRIALKNRRK